MSGVLFICFVLHPLRKISSKKGHPIGKEKKYSSFFREELSIADIQVAIESGEITSKELVMYYLHRIAKYDQDGPKINVILEINPDALFIVEALNYERITKGVRGPLHGIPVFLKDNIETNDSMHTSAGTLALQNHISSHDAFLVESIYKILGGR